MASAETIRLPFGALPPLRKTCAIVSTYRAVELMLPPGPYTRGKEATGENFRGPDHVPCRSPALVHLLSSSSPGSP